jgi:phage/conjugal plasmid C-4 type zinc finger TraR family protein
VDEIDQAQALNEQFLEGVLADHRHRQPTGESRFNCVDCEEPIPEARRIAAQGCQRCVDCQATQENWRPM